ncbi:MAG: hypothetical protein NC253_13590 [Ruminococcus sp.]|nr:hypothetical protein [Ruminococcus sp.]MCM1381719.1 hypothetical protein [Muribaculaceae bacterium]MCM1480096.1 hypothetical protein [Muribaculaceae bacterium]
MKFLFCALIAIGISVLVQPFTYMFLERWYKKNPDAEKTNSFELLDAVFRHKYTKAIYIAIGVICFIAAVIVFNMYILPTL